MTIINDWDKGIASMLAKSWANNDNRHGKIMELASSLVLGKTVLDVGCGIGHLSANFGKDISYVGIDSSISMIDEAKKAFPIRASSFFIGSAYDLSGFKSADTVFAVGLLNHLDDQQLAMEQLAKKFDKCLVFSLCIGETAKIGTAGCGEKFFLVRQNTIAEARELFKIAAREGDIIEAHEVIGGHASFGDTNTIFRIRRVN